MKLRPVSLIPLSSQALTPGRGRGRAPSPCLQGLGRTLVSPVVSCSRVRDPPSDSGRGLPLGAWSTHRIGSNNQKLDSQVLTSI